MAPIQDSQTFGTTRRLRMRKYDHSEDFGRLLALETDARRFGSSTIGGVASSSWPSPSPSVSFPPSSSTTHSAGATAAVAQLVQEGFEAELSKRVEDCLLYAIIENIPNSGETNANTSTRDDVEGSLREKTERGTSTPLGLGVKPKQTPGPKKESDLEKNTPPKTSTLAPLSQTKRLPSTFVGVVGLGPVLRREKKNRSVDMFMSIGSDYTEIVALTQTVSLPSAGSSSGVRGGSGSSWTASPLHVLDAGEWILEYAFSALKMHRVSVTVVEGDEVVYETYRHLGMTEEGRQRKSIWDETGKVWRDGIQMSVLEDEWLARKRGIHTSPAASLLSASKMFAPHTPF